MPSPTAMAFHKAGNTDVSLYTGSINVSIPLAAASSKTLASQVVLSYSASNGVKVEEMPTWVGLGWTLNAGGSVSRVTRGRIDDGESGYTALPALPPDAKNADTDQTVNDYLTNISNGTWDGEPDKFFFNAGGVSGSFFIQKDGNIMQVPQSDIKILPIYVAEGQIPIDNSLGATLVGSLVGFDILNVDGTKYSFRDYEFSNSRPISGSWTDNTFKVSSWYLTEISHPSHEGKITFEYEQYPTRLVTESVSNKIPLNGTHQPSFTVITTHALRLKQINHEGGKITFTTGGYRCDFRDDKILNSIEVWNINDQLLKKYSFEYTYFTETGVVPLEDSCDMIYLGGTPLNYDGDYRKRLKLDRILEWDETDSNSIVHSSFEYNQLYYLPNRHSKARDHWGYYNGQVGNTTLEPAYTKYLFLFGHEGYVYVHGGTANREPDPAYAQAGILRKISYKTGGSTEFIYEGNEIQSMEQRTRKIEGSPVTFHYDQGSDTVDANAPASEVTFEIMGPPMNDTYCGILITFKDMSGSTVADLNLEEQASGSTKGTINLPPDEYQISISTFNNGGGCIPELIPDLFANVSWHYFQSLGPEGKKLVGGLRIAKTVDTKGRGEVGLVNEYTYDGFVPGFSSGHLATVPKYGFIEVFDPALFTYNGWLTGPLPLTWIRTYNTNLPLATTKGGVVGYSRVIKKQLDKAGIPNGYTEYEYTSPFDQADFTQGWILNKYDDVVSFGAQKIEIYPPVVPDTRDWRRGLLLKQTDYRLENSNPIQVKRLTNNYDFITPEDNPTDPTFYVNAIKTDGPTYTKFYQQFSGRFHLNSTITTATDDSSPARTQTSSSNFYYEGNQHYLKTSETMLDSEGDFQKTVYKYPEDYSHTSEILDSLKSKNMVGFPIEQFRYVDSNITEANAMQYEVNGQHVVASGVFKYEPLTPSQFFPGSTDATGFPNHRQLTSVSYDSKGNVKSFTVPNGISTTYIWGHNQTLPLAKIENANESQVTSALALSGSALEDPTRNNLTTAEIQNLKNIEGSLLTLYEYIPGRGLSRVTDPNGLTTTYEYDAFGRLQLVKDHNDHIIQKVAYKYAGE